MPWAVSGFLLLWFAGSQDVDRSRIRHRWQSGPATEIPFLWCIVWLMAQRIVTVYTDDLTGTESDEVQTHTFSLNGVSYEVDLAPDSYDQLLDAFGPYLKVARKVSGRHRRGVTKRRNGMQDGPSAEEVRSWAKENGFSVNDRGRVPAEIREAYEDAH